MVGATAVVSTLGGFGNEEQMKRINGEANVIAVNAAKEYGKYFFFLDVHHYIKKVKVQKGHRTYADGGLHL